MNIFAYFEPKDKDDLLIKQNKLKTGNNGPLLMAH